MGRAQAEWRARGTNAIRRQLVELKLVSDGSLSCLGDALKSEDIWLKAFSRSGDASLLAYFVFVWGMSMWELTSDHREVQENVVGARRGYLRAYRRAKALDKATDPAAAANAERLREYLANEQELVDVILNSLTVAVDPEPGSAANTPPSGASGTLLLDAMKVESAVYSGSLVATKVRANNVVEICDSEVLVAELAKTGGPRAGIRDLLREVVGAHRTYYGCLALAAPRSGTGVEARLRGNLAARSCDSGPENGPERPRR